MEKERKEYLKKKGREISNMVLADREAALILGESFIKYVEKVEREVEMAFPMLTTVTAIMTNEIYPLTPPNAFVFDLKIGIAPFETKKPLILHVFVPVRDGKLDTNSVDVKLDGTIKVFYSVNPVDLLFDMPYLVTQFLTEVDIDELRCR